MDLKVKILNISAEIFAEQGIKKAKLQDIASAIHISKKTIYKYFEGKEDLVRQTYSYWMNQINSEADALAASDNCAQILAGFVRIAATRLNIVTPILIHDIQHEYAQVFTGVFDNYLHHSIFTRFKAIVDAGVEKGCIKQNVNKESVVLQYKDAMMNFAYMRTSRDNVPGNFTTRTDLQLFCDAISLLFAGILNEDQRAEFESLIAEINY